MDKRIVSVVIPVYNEEARLSLTLQSIDNFFAKERLPFEIIVVNDGSTDQTANIVEKWQSRMGAVDLLSYDKNRGKGFAVRMGVTHAKGGVILISDADLSTPINAFQHFYGALKNGYDIAIGSRRMKGAWIRLHQPLHRRIAGRAFGWLVELILIRGIKDTQCGFKLMKRGVAQRAFSLCQLNGFSYDVELIYVAKKVLGARIAEIPVEWWDSAELSKVTLRKEAFPMFLDLLRIRMRH